MAQQQTIKITVIVAGRPYPLRIKAEDEPAVRRIVKEVNDKITSFQAAYQDRDKQDALSMAVLTYAFDGYKQRKEAVNEPGLEAQIAAIDDLLSQML